MADEDPASTPSTGQNLINQIQAEDTEAARTTVEQVAGAVRGMFNPHAAAAEHAATAAAVGRGFQLTPEQIETTPAQARSRIVNHQNHLRDAKAAEQAVHAPGPDPVSVANAAKIKQSLSNLQGRIQSYITYWQDWQRKLTAAKQSYMETEQINEDQWRRLAGGLDT